MKELTAGDVAPIMSAILGYTYKEHETAALIYARFANAILAKYGTPPDERALIERERAAWDAAVERWHATYSICGYSECMDSMKEERNRRYPLPKAEPQPVLTDHDINQLWDGNIIPRGYFDLTRKIERAVLTKLAEQKP